jgi:hypothetical protein
LKSAGGELRVAGAKGMVDEIAHTSNIPRVVPFHGTIEEAVNAMNTKADPGA